MVTPDATVLNATKYTLTVTDIRKYRLTSCSPKNKKLTSTGVDMIINLDCQVEWIYNHVGDKSLGIFMGVFQRGSTEIDRKTCCEYGLNPTLNKKVQKRK